MKLKTLASLCLIAFVASAHAQTYSVIHAFNGQDGQGPYAGVTLKAGVLYGTTPRGTENTDQGTIYQLKQQGSSWIFGNIFTLPINGSGGAYPYAGLVFGPDNRPYGITSHGGSAQGDGVVFSLTPPVSLCKTVRCAGGDWTENVLHQFAGAPDGRMPAYGNVTFDPQGNLYGTTQLGGAYFDSGTVFQMTKAGNTWTETPIYSFDFFHQPANGYAPQNGVIIDPNGNLFGTTLAGGANNLDYGTVFELTNVPGVGWQETVLYSFQGTTDGIYPYAGMLSDNSGNLYGATTDGGSGGAGTVFELSPSGNTWIFTLLHSFSGQSGQNCGSWGTLTMDASGNLYGTTKCSGANQLGNVFKLTNTQNGWVYSSLHDFAGGTDGAWPACSVAIDTDGTLYGTTRLGGFQQNGIVWMIKP
jgi:uncharacterized repeat protein (TIGR03803 family)